MTVNLNFSGGQEVETDSDRAVAVVVAKQARQALAGSLTYLKQHSRRRDHSSSHQALGALSPFQVMGNEKTLLRSRALIQLKLRRRIAHGTPHNGGFQAPETSAMSLPAQVTTAPKTRGVLHASGAQPKLARSGTSTLETPPACPV